MCAPITCGIRLPGQSTEVWDKIYFGFRVVRNVTQPTLTPFPAGRGTGAAVVVVPGGGFTLVQPMICCEGGRSRPS
jgi:hypothetical protein